MEHLPLAGRSAPIVVPYVCEEEYDGGNFMDYPERKGWGLDVWPGVFKLYTREVFKDVLSFLQTWLFFGTLISVLGGDVVTADFIRNDQGRKYITTIKLQNYVEEWADRDGKLSDTEKILKWESITAILAKGYGINRIVRMYLEKMQPHILEERVSHELDGELTEVLFCIEMLNHALNHAKIRIFRGKEWYGLSYTPSLLLRARMTQAGWCPYTVKLLEDDLELDCQAYAFSLGSIRTLQDHSQCTSEHCEANQVKGTYRVKHCSSYCQCEDVGPTTEDINDALCKGGYPIIKLTWFENKLQLTAEPYTGDDYYVAISHVWSDGLGNPVSNTLPYCQLLSIEKTLRAMMYKRADAALYDQETPLYFWLDTLCIPVQQECRDLRFAAIHRMCATYENAEACLVLDADLQQLPECTTATDLFVKVFMSVWRQRLWTLQESSLSIFTFIQGKDCVFELSRLWLQLRKSINKGGETTPLSEPIHCELIEALLVRWTRSVQIHRPLVDRIDRLTQRFIAAISNRLTSHPGDETLCIASFLKIDPSPLKKEPIANRMQVLLSMLPVIPLSILFAQGPRLDTEGFRWAPPTLLAPHGVDDLILDDKVPLDRLKPNELVPRPPPYLHPKGLVVCLPGFQLYRPSTVTPPLFYVHTPDPDIWSFEAFRPFDQSLRWRDVTPHQHENSAILLADFDYNIVSGSAILVSLRGKTAEGHVFVRSIAPLLVTRYDLETADAHFGEPRRRIDGVYLPPQTWCID